MNSVQDCLNALEQGQRVMLWDGSHIYKEDGNYTHEPYLDPTSIVASPGNCLRTEDRFTFFAHVALRDGVVEQGSSSYCLTSTVEPYEL